MFLHVKEVIKVLSRGGLSKWAALKAAHVHRSERGAEQCAQVDEEKRGTEMGNRKTENGGWSVAAPSQETPGNGWHEKQVLPGGK